MEVTGSRHFGVWDYVVFAIMLLLSALIGIYSALSGGRQRTADEFFLGDRKMSILPVAMSIVVSYVSAISMIGTPGEIYMYNCMFAWGLISYIIANCLFIRLFLPIFVRLRITSVYEFLEMRFNRTVRTVCTVFFSIQTILYMGIAMYTPALAINAVTGMDLWACVVSTGLVCIFYTTVGGMKAVLWTDTLQAIIILLGVAAVVIKGSIEVGGLGEVWRIGYIGGRIKFNETGIDPRITYSVWSMVLGLGTVNLGTAISQTVVQRLLSCGTKRKALQAIILSTVFKFIVVGLCILSGVVMYVYYVDCDPYTQGVVMSKDQLMPLMVMDLFSNMPGLPGLFLSAVVSASISTLSSGVNSLAALSGEDGVKVLWPNISARKYTRIVKLLALMYGLLSIAFAFMASQLGQGVLSLCLSIVGITYGGMTGVFILGIFMHRCNSKGAIVGLVTSVLFLSWIKIGSMIYPSRRGKNSLSVEGCPVENTTESTGWQEATTLAYYTDFPSTLPQDDPGIADFYAISFLYYSPIGLIVCMTVAMIVSSITGFTDPDTIDPKLKNNFTDALCCCFPESLKRRMRCTCGMDKVKDMDDIDDDDVKDMKYFNGVTENLKEINCEEKERMIEANNEKYPENTGTMV